MRETPYQAQLRERLEEMFPGCFITKLDTRYFQGIPDLLVLYKNKWAILEVKRSSRAAERPNQPYYVDQFNRMSYSAFVYPENEEEVLNDLQHLFAPRRQARHSQSQ